MQALRRFGAWGASSPHGLVKQVRTVIVKRDPPPVMLAHPYKGQDVSGWWYSEKLDGIRAYWNGSMLQTRNGVVIATPIGFQKDMRKYFPKEKADGELFIRKDYFQQTMGQVMRHADPDRKARWKAHRLRVRFIVFDLPSKPNQPFEERLARMKKYAVAIDQARALDPDAAEHLNVIPYRRLPKKAESANALLRKRLASILKQRGEGIMLREPASPYVASRSQHLLKVKEVEDSEALVFDWSEGLGKHEGMVGALRCRLHNGISFEVGSGLPDSGRYSPDEFLNKVITVRHQGVTDLGVPRFPVFIGLRLDRCPEEFAMMSEAIANLS